jgi:hypothetical protein
MVIVKSDTIPGKITLKATSPGLVNGILELEAAHE